MKDFLVIVKEYWYNEPHSEQVHDILEFNTLGECLDDIKEKGYMEDSHWCKIVKVEYKGNQIMYLSSRQCNVESMKQYIKRGLV